MALSPGTALGADCDALEALAAELRSYGVSLQQSVQTLSARVEEAWWQGPDADSFRSQWSGEISAVLRRAAELALVAGDGLAVQARMQRDASQS